MTNINFDNPYLLLLLIPLLAIILVPFFIAVRKENRTKATVIALVCHIFIVVFSVLAAAGMNVTTLMTKTELYVLADVSYSTNEKTEIIDRYVEKVKEELPDGSEMGVIAFAKDHKLHTPLGEEITALSVDSVDRSATDVVSALKYADSLFSDNAIKRVVIITDGMSTDPNASTALAMQIADMKSRGVYVDAMYVDSNISPETPEIQVSSVDFAGSTFLGGKSGANVLIESSYDTDVIVRLLKNGEKYGSKAVNLTVGYNIVNFDLDTSAAGEYDYSVTFDAQSDTSNKNNFIEFTQTVSEKVKILLITAEQSDKDAVLALYGESADVTALVKEPDKEPTYSNPNPKPSYLDVPYTVEELCYYDEIIISNIDITYVKNYSTFLSSLDTVVSVFGKSLITAGDNNLQNLTGNEYKQLKDMLPVRFGNDESDPKLYMIVVDTSRSLEHSNFDFFTIAKESAKSLLGLLNDHDYFSVVFFSGSPFDPILPQEATKENVQKAMQTIDSYEVTQGTMIGGALETAFEMMINQSFSDKQVMLISDGMSFEGSSALTDDPIKVAEKMAENGITVSTINTGNLEQQGIDTLSGIAYAGGGEYYFVESSDDLDDVMFKEIADDVTESVVEKSTEVKIGILTDKMLENISALPNVNGYVYARAKASAETVLYVKHVKKSGAVSESSLYSYWEYGNGRVSSFNSNFGGEWVSEWSTGEGALFLSRIIEVNTPKSRIDYPFTINTISDGKFVYLEMVPAVLNPDATMTLTVTLPDGTEITEQLAFDSYSYSYRFESTSYGKYKIKTVYDWLTKSYESQTIFNISYPKEYDAFAAFTPASLHTVMRNNGSVFENGDYEAVVDEDEIATYVFSFTVPFLIVAVALFIVDTVVRKIKWIDVKSLFKSGTEEETK